MAVQGDARRAVGLRRLLPVLIPALAAASYGWAEFVSTFIHPGSIGLDYIAPGTDWMVLYSAARLALQHHLALALHGSAFTSYLNATFSAWLSQPLQYRPWLYPPSFLPLLLPFGALGFAASYAAFQVLTAALLAAALLYRPDSRSAAPLIAAAALVCPAASINAVDGQCAFLVAGLLVLGLRLLPSKPFLAGIVIGLLTFKPQFGMLLPIPLLLIGGWRAVLGATASALALAVASAIAFGFDPWVVWFGQIAQAAAANSEWTLTARLAGNSVYACVVLLGLSSGAASVVQDVAILGSAVAVFLAYRTALSPDRRLAVLLAAIILAAPHSSPYDAILLTIAAGLWLAGEAKLEQRHGILALFLWLSPLLGPPFQMPVGRFVPLLVLGFIGVVLMPPLAAGQPAQSA